MSNFQPIAFKDGAAYDCYMGAWSRLAGEAFLDWLKPGAGLRWLDVGCGNGAFTELIVNRCAPAAVEGIDPSDAQLEAARAHPALRAAGFRKADAMDLPFPEDAFDAAVMPLVIFFLTDPAKGVAEMARVVARGGLVTAYAWDMPGGGFPYAALQEEMQAMGRPASRTPSPEVSRLEALLELWKGAGLEAVSTKAYAVERTFAGFEEYWSVVQGGPSVAPTLAALSFGETEHLKARLRSRLPAVASGRMVLQARVHAIQGRVK
jgi:SAM-dependent methyltransferase